MGKRVTDPNQSQTEFIFGALSTASGRIQRDRSLNAGLQLAPHLAPIDPRPGEAVTISVQAGVGVALEAATLYYTQRGMVHFKRDGSRTNRKINPAPTAINSALMPNAPTAAKRS